MDSYFSVGHDGDTWGERGSVSATLGAPLNRPDGIGGGRGDTAWARAPALSGWHPRRSFSVCCEAEKNVTWSRMTYRGSGPSMRSVGKCRMNVREVSSGAPEAFAPGADCFAGVAGGSLVWEAGPSHRAVGVDLRLGQVTRVIGLGILVEGVDVRALH